MSFFTFLTFSVLLVFTEHIAGDDQCLAYITGGSVPKFADKVKSADLRVQWDGKDVPCAASKSLTDTLNPPVLYYDAPKCCKNITVLVFLPDTVYTPPFLVWLLHNVPADNFRKGFTTPLIGPNYPNNGYYACSYDIPKDATFGMNSKRAHLVFFLYCPCGYVSDKYIFLETPATRGSFDVKAYAKSHKLGNPITGYSITLRAPKGVPAVDPGSVVNQTVAPVPTIPM